MFTPTNMPIYLKSSSVPTSNYVFAKYDSKDLPIRRLTSLNIKHKLRNLMRAMHKISSKFRAAWVQAQTEHMFKSNMISTWDQGFKHQILHMRARAPALNPTNRCRRKLLTRKNKPYQNNTTLELKPSSNFSATLYNECNFVQHSRGMSSVLEHWELNVSLQARNLILTNNSVHELLTVSHNSVTFGSNVILLESKMQSKEMPSEANSCADIVTRSHNLSCT